MSIKKIFGILALSYILAIATQGGFIFYEMRSQDHLTQDLCQLLGLPLNTGSLREAFEGFESALLRSHHGKTCVSITDNGRSYSPDCVDPKLNYHMTMCKAEANTGVRAAIYYEQKDLFANSLFTWWISFFCILALGLYVLQLGTRHVASTFSLNVIQLLNTETGQTQNILQKASGWVLEKLGISKILSEQAKIFRSKLTDYEVLVQEQTMAKARLEADTKHNLEYIEKVRQIRHDIRSPLTSLQAVFEQAPVDQESTFALASAIRRIQLLLEDLNQVDQVAEKKSLIIAEIAIDELALAMRSKYEANKSAKLTLQYSINQLCPIFVGKKDFDSLIENLLENAFDAIAVGGEVQLKISQISGFCEVIVEDNGCGVTPEARAKLFTRGGTFGKISGIGLGLYHCKKLVESWGGSIRYEPLEKGTQFIVRVPLMQTGVVFVGLEDAAKFKVIDDDSMVPKALANAGFEIVEVASNFEDGRKLLAAGKPEGVTILVDNRLGDGKFGTELIAEQRARSGLILCTFDYDDRDLIAKAREIGVKILPKPLCFSKQYWTSKDSRHHT